MAQCTSPPTSISSPLNSAARPSPLWPRCRLGQHAPDGLKVASPHLRLAPNIIIGSKTTIDLGNMVAELIPVGPAHTYGDIIVYLPEKKVLFAGDVGFFYVAPYVHWGNFSNWILELNRILDMDVTTIVPGHGPIGGKREIAEQRDYLILFQKEARKRFDAKMTPGQAASTITLGKFDAWRGAQDRLPMNTVRAFHEFNGTLTAPDGRQRHRQRCRRVHPHHRIPVPHLIPISCHLAVDVWKDRLNAPHLRSPSL